MAPIISKDISNSGSSEIFTKIKACVNQGAAVLNNSWGYDPGVTIPPAVGKAFAYAYNMDRVCVAAAGNDTTSIPEFPAALQKLISVSATDPWDEFCSFSNRGNTIDVAAPGLWVYSTYSPSQNYDYLNGTSMASPHVSGLAALLKSHFPSLWNDDIRNLIEYSAKDRGTVGWDTLFGWGRIDAQAAFELMQAPRILDNTLIASGNPYNYWVSGPTTMMLYGVPGLVDGVYIVKVYDVRRDVSFARPYLDKPAVWGRGAASASSGYVFQDGVAVFDFKDCNVVPSSITTTGCTISTHVYEVWDYGGDPVGFKPVSPSSVVMPYSVLGELVLDPITDIVGTLIFPSTQGNRFVLGWVDPNPNSTGEIVSRRVGETGDWTYLDSLPQSGEYIQNGIDQLVGSQTYYYRVRPSTCNQGAVNWSPTRSFRNPPQPPTQVSATVMTRPQGEGGGPSQRISLEWQAPQNQLDSSIQFYKVRVKYPSHPLVEEWIDSLTSLSTQFCATYWTDTVDITVFAYSNWNELGRASSTVRVISGGYEAGCYTSQDPPGGGNNSTTPPGDSLAKAVIPTEFALDQNHPNPFNPVTTIAFSLPHSSDVRLIVFNALGQQIRSLYTGVLTAGRHEFQWDSRDNAGRPVSSGVYLYRLDAGEFSQSRKMLLLK